MIACAHLEERPGDTVRTKATVPDDLASSAFGLQDDRRQADALTAGANRLLARLAQGHALESILEGVCQLAEGLLDRSWVSIMRVGPGDNRLWFAARGGLPTGYADA